jgi:hypothetical protein
LITLKGQYCNWPALPDSVIPFNLSRDIKASDNGKCGWCKNYCKQAVACKPKEIVKLNKCFYNYSNDYVLLQ